jgi:hypothetical protein
MYKTMHYYNYQKLLSYNAVYNICVGGRGLGKTYGAKKRVITDAIRSAIKGGIENCDQFIYLRRYKPEIRLAKDTFFADIWAIFPEWDFRVNSVEAQMAPISTRKDSKRQWETIGYFLPLVQAQHFKSVAFPRVKTIIFDEFIIETGLIRYLPNETTVFNNFYSTVDRYKEKTRVFFLANSVSVANPYFVEWDIDPREADDNGIIKKVRGFLVCHFPESKEFNSQAYETAFGKFIEGTTYAEYAVENQFADNHQALIDRKTANAEYLYTLETKAGTFSVWYDLNDDIFYCQQKKPKIEVQFTLEPSMMTEDKLLFNWSDRPLSSLRGSFRRGRVFFDKPMSRNAFMEVFRQ